MIYTPISISGEGGVPEPFNINDVTVWSDLICKFVCQNTNTSFDIGDFLDEIIHDRLMPLNAYNKKMLKKTKRGARNVFYNIIVYCLEFLQGNRLLTTEPYLPTERLKTICPKVNRILMPGIRPLLDAERAIRNDQDYPGIVRLLKELEGERKLDRRDAIKLITPTALRKLTQFGIITLYLDERVEITTLGELALPLLER